LSKDLERILPSLFKLVEIVISSELAAVNSVA